MRSLRNLGFAFLLYVSAAHADQVTIAAFGDSLTAGYGLNTGEGFVPQMQAWLDNQGVEVALINAGVSGDTTAGGLSRVEWSLTPEIDGVILALGANDYLRGLEPSHAADNLSGILDVLGDADVEVLLVGMKVGSNFGIDYKQEFDRIYPELSAEYETLFFPNWFAGLLAAAGMQEGFTQFMQADGLHPNAEGVRIIVAAMGPKVLELVEMIED